MRFYLDENLSQEIAILARARGLDVVSGHELGHDGWSDEQQLAFAAEQGRIFVTADCADLTPMSILWHAEGRPHAGVLCFVRPPSRHEFAGAVRALQVCAAQFPLGMPAYLVLYADRL
jgi:predicted nuclease of predicted toxin-antitoxin system